ncbi:hypothetical protein L0E83_10675 [Marichromatium gracile]|uniref:hypothetical protein n=1 Tax=Marichromatium gracile TaxID=1048 RepID=UPI001F2A24D0|nr:hypothetical protein [Marichromatium gracile]MCF1183894.1 hypothetical protein [Marichromatium gracile]
MAQPVGERAVALLGAEQALLRRVQLGDHVTQELALRLIDLQLGAGALRAHRREILLDLGLITFEREQGAEFAVHRLLWLRQLCDEAYIEIRLDDLGD